MLLFFNIYTCIHRIFTIATLAPPSISSLTSLGSPSTSCLLCLLNNWLMLPILAWVGCHPLKNRQPIRATYTEKSDLASHCNHPLPVNPQLEEELQELLPQPCWNISNFDLSADLVQATKLLWVHKCKSLIIFGRHVSQYSRANAGYQSFRPFSRSWL